MVNRVSLISKSRVHLFKARARPAVSSVFYGRRFPFEPTVEYTGMKERSKQVLLSRHYLLERLTLAASHHVCIRVLCHFLSLG